MARKLASIQKVLEVMPIPDADLIECVKIMGWRCVVKKEEKFKVGDLVLYFEIDSVLPEEPEFEFLRSCNFRIRTRKFKSQISQGLVLPLLTFEKYGKLIYDNSGNIIGVELNDISENTIK